MDVFPISTVKPDKVTDISLEFKTTIVEFENQYDQRFANDHVGKLRWKLSWVMMNRTEYGILSGFFNAQIGRLKQWTIQDPRINNGLPANVFFANDKISYSTIKAGFFKCDVEIETR